MVLWHYLTVKPNGSTKRQSLNPLSYSLYDFSAGYDILMGKRGQLTHQLLTHIHNH